MTDSAHEELARLRNRVERMEALEACRGRFNEYLHYLDAGYLEDLLRLFADDARLELRNFPPGTGDNPDYNGPDEIRGLYAVFVGEGARHHSANVSVVPSDSFDRVEMAAYFLTTLDYAFTGGIYELQFRLQSTWQISRLRISSTWGWSVPHSDPPFLKESFSAGTLRAGRTPSSRSIDWKQMFPHGE